MSIAENADPRITEFEEKRLAFMSSQGFACEPFRIKGRSGRSTYLMAAGEGTPARLLIHGGMSDGSAWGVLAGRLQGRVNVADRPGYGLSDPIDYRRIRSFKDAAAEWVAEVVDGLGEDRIDLVGNSMGGFFAIAFAVAHPDRVRRLVLVGNPAGLSPEAPLFFRLWGNPIGERVIRRMKFKDVDQFRDSVFSTLVAHPERVPDQQVEVEFAAGQLPAFGFTTHTMLRSVTTLRGWKRDQLLDEALAHLDTPTLFIWGDSDATAPPSKGQPIADRMSHATFEVIQDAGHVPWVDQPDPVAASINHFLKPTHGA